MSQPANDETRSVARTGAAGRLSLRRLRTFSSLANPVYRLYFVGTLGQTAAMSMDLMTNSLLAYRLTNSYTMLGVMSVAYCAPQFILGLFGGALADRVQKKFVLLAAFAGSGIVAASVAISLATGYMSPEHAGSWWVLMVAVIIQGGILSLCMPSRQAIIREIVEPEHVMNAVALNNLGSNTLRLTAPALAGFLIEALDFQAIYFLEALLYLYAIVLLTFLPRTTAFATSPRQPLADIKDGLKYIRSELTIMLLIIFSFSSFLLSMPYLTLMPIFTEDILKVGAGGLGLLISVSGVGAMLGSVTLASLPNRKRGLLLLSGTLVLGVALAGFSFSKSWYLSLGLIAVVGLAQVSRMTLVYTLYQYYVQQEFLGRVLSISMMEWGIQGLGTFFASLLAGVMGVQWAVGGFGMVLALLCLLGLLFVPRIRKLE